ncbi:MAG: SCP2 sterol-binding domain-containing protein [Deltaproteobacteria bacterium]|nr:SCP2 sterol-binding domain-containing protein [Deltaproteobacteria bacterium]
MPYFQTSEKFEEVLGGFFKLMGETPVIADKLLKSKLIIRFRYTDPDLVMVIDCSGDKIDVRPNDTDTKAIVEMSMSSDIAHKFWFGKINLTKALTRREMIAKGPIPKVLKLLPAIKPSYNMYPKYLDENGYEQYNILKAYKPVAPA